MSNDQRELGKVGYFPLDSVYVFRKGIGPCVACVDGSWWIAGKIEVSIKHSFNLFHPRQREAIYELMGMEGRL